MAGAVVRYALLELCLVFSMREQGAFGRALRQVRIAKGWSQYQLPPAVGLRHISDLERGVKEPSARTIEVICRRMDAEPLLAYVLAYAESPKDVDVLVEGVKAAAKHILEREASEDSPID